MQVYVAELRVAVSGTTNKDDLAAHIESVMTGVGFDDWEYVAEPHLEEVEDSYMALHELGIKNGR